MREDVNMASYRIIDWSVCFERIRQRFILPDGTLVGSDRIRGDPVGSDENPVGSDRNPVGSDRRNLSDSDTLQLPIGILRPGFRQIPIGSYRNVRFPIGSRRNPIGSDGISIGSAARIVRPEYVAPQSSAADH